MPEVYLVGNDNLIEARGLKNAASDAFINGATVTVTLVDSAGATVTGVDALAMDYVATSNGIYRATLKDTLTITKNQQYTAKITADGGAELKGYWEIEVRSQIRDS